MLELNSGTTGSLTPLGKVIIILLMFLGRVGPVVLGMAFFNRSSQSVGPIREEDVAI